MINIYLESGDSGLTYLWGKYHIHQTWVKCLGEKSFLMNLYLLDCCILKIGPAGKSTYVQLAGIENILPSSYI